MSRLAYTTCQATQAWSSMPPVRSVTTKSPAMLGRSKSRSPALAGPKRRFPCAIGCWLNARGSSRQSSRIVSRAGREDVVESSKALPAQPSETDTLQDWPQVALCLFVIGFFLGPLLDGIHSRVGLQEYDAGALNILGLKTNVLVPPLLGVFYSVVGSLQLLLDKQFATRGQTIPADAKRVVGSLVALTALLELSAELFKAGVPYNIESYILFIAAEANWVLFDSTWWGFALACVVAIGCPLGEVPVQKLFGVWHYTKPNYELFGVGAVTWVLCCYFFYTPFLSNLSRWLSSYLRRRSTAPLLHARHARCTESLRGVGQFSQALSGQCLRVGNMKPIQLQAQRQSLVPPDGKRLPVLLFDVMGTLVFDPFYTDMAGFFGMSMKELLTSKHPTAWIDFEKGLLTEDELVETFFEDGRSFNYAGLKECMARKYCYLDGVESLLERLKAAGYEMHAFTNYPCWYSMIEEKLNLSKYLPWTFVSCEMGFRKPDREAYARAAKILDVLPSSCLFVDDRQVNVSAAVEFGMAGLVFESATKLEQDLAVYGITLG